MIRNDYRYTGDRGHYIVCPGCGKAFPRGTAREVFICCVCGHRWDVSEGKTDCCPGCGSSRWHDMPDTLTCMRCGHTWRPRAGGRPRKCPGCGSIRWDSASVCGDEELDSAVIRCISGEGVIRVCMDTDVPLLGIIGELVSRGYDYTL